MASSASQDRSDDAARAVVAVPRSARTSRLFEAYRGRGRPVVRDDLRVAVVGAGLAGLSAAYVLRRRGLHPAVFDAATIAGGRVRTDRGAPGAPLVTELGGEFIDSRHHDLLALARLFDLPLIDTAAPSEDALETAYVFGGRRYRETEVAAAFGDVADRIARDIASLSPRPGHRRHTPVDRRFDHLSIADYLHRLDMAPWLRDLLGVAFATVYGSEPGEQSSLNLLTLIGTDPDRFEVFGTSDERYKIRDGADRLVAGLADGLGDRVYPEHRLVRLASRGAGYRLALQTASRVVEIDADVVVLALPFTMLRQVELDVDLPPTKRAAIASLGYGTNAKLMVEVDRRVWRDRGLSGSVYSDTALQSSWDGSRLRAGERGMLTCFLAGREGVAVGEGTVAAQADRFAKIADTVFPRFAAARTGRALRVHWPTEPLAQGSYTAYRPGQWTAFGGEEVATVGQLYFAGEHCATASQGYMNGAAETGRQAAQAILARLR